MTTKKETTKTETAKAGPAIAVRGRTFEGRIISARMRRTATFEMERQQFIPKYQRYERRRTRIKVHNPDEIGAKEGDFVRIRECRPLSKTKHFVIIAKLGGDHAAD